MLSDPRFTTYLELLLKWNKAYNLTAIVDREEILIKHFEDSLSPLPFLPASGRLLDIGAGAGFPGLPLKLARPELEVTLLDAVQKKVSFCAAAIRELKLDGIRTVHGRAEDKKTVEQLGLFDVVVTRATFSLEKFLKLARSYLQSGGVAIAMKGRDWKKEFGEFFGWKLKTAFDYDLSHDLGQRTLLIFEKL